MFRWVYIEESLPRDYRLIMANTNEGLQGLNFWGYVLIFLSILFSFTKSETCTKVGN